MLRETLQDHDQLMVHVSAYPPAAAMVDAMQSAGGIQIWAKQRVRFEHGDGLTPELIPRKSDCTPVVELAGRKRDRPESDPNGSPLRQSR
jgi:hypothetical protein